ncbi:hypothetical protein HYY69_04030 [Candidatus Woesearchaeota archaeon]|nr:hypothetical protein [Candidatus Woesearchaeota archaeon]
MKKIITLITIAIILLVLLIGCKNTTPKYSQKELAGFAQCLTDKGAVMYGAFWCPHCQNVKKRFGSAFQFVKYVECDPRGENGNPDLCLKKDIKNYATFEFSDGTRLIGEPTLEELSEKTGCPLSESTPGN